MMIIAFLENSYIKIVGIFAIAGHIIFEYNVGVSWKGNRKVIRMKFRFITTGISTLFVAFKKYTKIEIISKV